MANGSSRVERQTLISTRWFPGARHEYVLYIPAAYDHRSPACLYVSQDGLRDGETEVLDRLIAEGAMPVTLGVFVWPGVLSPSLPGGFERSARCPEYDGLGAAYAGFLIDELLPELERRHGVRFSRNPDDCAIGGCSSGGICAFNVCWERPDAFRRAYLNSPTFSAFRGGEELPFLVRKVETRPLRLYLTAGTEDMRNAGGDWYLETLTMKEALQYAGYDFACEWFEGGRHGAGFADPAVFERVQRFLWRGWPQPVEPRGLPPRVADVVSSAAPWSPTSAPLPAVFAGPYRAAGRTVFCGDRPVVADAGGEVTGLALSVDRWRLYLTLRDERRVYAWRVQPDGSLVERWPWGWLYLADDGHARTGAVAVDREERLYVATPPGIQLIDDAGHVNGILPLPGGAPAVALGFAGPAGDELVVETATGARFRRPVRTRGVLADTPIQQPRGIPL